MDYLEIQSATAAEHKDVYAEVTRCYAQKLWYQMGVKLEKAVLLPYFQAGDVMVQLHDKVLKKIAKKLNQQSYVKVCIVAARQMGDAAKGVSFLEDVLENVVEGDAQASMMCRMEVCRLQVSQNELVKAKVLLDAGNKAMSDYMGIMEPSVQSHLYLASLEYYKAKGPPTEYFKQSLLYLTYTPLESIPVADQVSLAADVSMAAVLGASIYNFGELLQHPVVGKLAGTNQEWIASLLGAFNAGDIPAFDQVFKQQAPKHAAMQNAEKFLIEKIRIMALIELMFSKDATSRNVGFAEVANTCQCTVVEVEHLLMKCFSLGVLKGLIDQVAQTVRVTYVQPRVLDTDQLATIRDRIQQWSKQVSNAATYLESNAPDLLAAH